MHGGTWTSSDLQRPSSLKALHFVSITHQHSLDFTGETSYLAEANTEYLFIGIRSVTSSTSQTLFPSSTIKIRITLYQVVDNYGSIKTFYMCHSCRNYLIIFASLHLSRRCNCLDKSSLTVYRNHIGPQDWKETQKLPWLVTDGRICLTASKSTNSCLSICYLITMVHNMLKLTSRSARETWEGDDITGHTKCKRKEIKTAGCLCAWVSDSRMFALGHTESHHQCQDLGTRPPGMLI